MKNHLDELIDEYRQDGVDSEGHFTLNPARGKELLEKFQLPEPALYVLHILSFLIGAGATQILIKSSKAGLQIQAPGAVASEEAVRSPFSVLLKNSAEPFRSEWAMGLNTLLAQPEGKAQLTSGCCSGTYTGGSIEFEELEETSTLQISLWPRMEGERELELVREHFKYSPVPIKIDGISLAKKRYFKPLVGLEVHLKNGRYPLVLASNEQNRIEKVMEAPFSALISIGKHAPVFRVICLGRSFEQVLPWGIQVSGWCVQVTVCSDQFEKDLSQQNLLLDTRLANLQSALRVQCEQATEFLLTHVPPLSGSEILVDDLVESEFHRGDKKKALLFQRKLAKAYALKSATLSKGKALYRLALIEQRLNERSPGLNTEFAKEGLLGIRCSEQSEPQWSVLKAQLAFSQPHTALIQRAVDWQDDLGNSSESLEYVSRWILALADSSWEQKRASRIGLARQLFASDRVFDAIAEIELALEGPEKELSADMVNHRQALELGGEMYAELGLLEPSITHFARLLDFQSREMYGEHSKELGLTLKRLAHLLRLAGKTRQAKEYEAWSQRLHY